MKSKVLIFPTDTVYGIGTPLYDSEGIKRIYQIKGRDFNKPLAVLVSSIKEAEKLVVFNQRALLLANAFWPGALSIILPTTSEYYNRTNEKTLAIRIPNHKTALQLIKQYGPLKTTSVNFSGQTELNDYQLIFENFSAVVDEIFENNQEILKHSSTIIDLTGETAVILRSGTITKNMIDKILAS